MERLPEEVCGAQHLAHGCGSRGYLGRPSKLQLEWAWQIKQERWRHVWSDVEKQLAESSVQCCSSSRSSMNMRRSAWGWNKGGREAAAAGGEGCFGGGRGRVGLDGAVLLRTEKIQSDHRKFGPNLSPAREVLPSRATWSITGQLPRERGCLAARCF